MGKATRTCCEIIVGAVVGKARDLTLEIREPYLQLEIDTIFKIPSILQRFHDSDLLINLDYLGPNK